MPAEAETTLILAGFDTGTEVCASEGLTCVTSVQYDGTEVACGSVPTGTTAGYFHVLCE